MVGLLLALLGCMDYSLVDLRPPVEEPLHIPRANVLDYPRYMEDEFSQGPPGGVLDVVVCVDTSGSMDDNLSDVGAAVALVADQVQMTDWEVWFITSDQHRLGTIHLEEGLHLPADLIIAPAILPGAFREACLEAVVVAVVGGEVILRPDAHLLVMVASDEREQSALTADEWVGWADARYPGSYLYEYVAVTSNGDCGDETPKYQRVAALSGGTWHNICESWTSNVVPGSWLVGPRTRFQLSAKPRIDTLEVTVDGVPDSSWYLDGLDLVFPTPPPPDVLVVASYWTD